MSNVLQLNLPLRENCAISLEYQAHTEVQQLQKQKKLWC